MSKHLSQIQRDEHARIGGVDGKKVFVVDDQGNQIIDFGAENYAFRTATDSGDANVTYLGRAAIGTATSVEEWQIRKVDETSGTVITWANSDDSFNNKWDDRESLSYS